MLNFISLQKRTSHSTDLNPHSLFSLGYLAKNLPMSMKKCVNRLSSLRSSECYQRQMARCRHQSTTIRKPHSSGKSV